MNNHYSVLVNCKLKQSIGTSSTAQKCYLAEVCFLTGCQLLFQEVISFLVFLVSYLMLYFTKFNKPLILRCSILSFPWCKFPWERAKMLPSSTIDSIDVDSKIYVNFRYAKCGKNVHTSLKLRKYGHYCPYYWITLNLTLLLEYIFSTFTFYFWVTSVFPNCCTLRCNHCKSEQKLCSTIIDCHSGWRVHTQQFLYLEKYNGESI